MFNTPTTMFFRRLHVLTAAGVTIHVALEHLEKTEVDPVFRQTLEDCLQDLMAGHSISACFARHPRYFSTLATELISTGERTGGLVTVFDYIATYQERHIKRIHQVVAALIYPTLLFLVMLGVTWLYVYILAGKNSVLFANLGEATPWPTRVLTSAASVMGSPKFLVLTCGGFLLIFFVVRRALTDNLHLRRWAHRMSFRIPLLGPVFLQIETARMVDVLASTLTVGLPLTEALRCARKVCQNVYFKEALSGVSQAVIQGESLTDAFDANLKLPTYVLALVEVGEAAGVMEEVLGRASVMLDGEVEDASDRMVQILEPLLLSLGGFAAAFVAVATFLPIIRLMTTF